MPLTSTARLVNPATGGELLSYGGWTADGVLEQLDLGFPEVRVGKVNRSGAHGVLDVTRWAGSRLITAVVGMPSRPDTDTAVDNLAGLMNPSLRLWLYVQRPSWDQERRILVRGSAFTCPPGVNRKAQVIWEAAGGLFEDGDEPNPVVLMPSGTGTGGLAMPVTMPATMTGGVVSGSTFVYVGGNAPAPFVVDMYGPCTDPAIRCIDTGEQTKFVGLTLHEGEFLRVDTDAQTALLNGLENQSRTNLLDFATSTWFSLPPGLRSQVVFAPSTPSGACQARFFFRSRWF